MALTLNTIAAQWQQFVVQVKTIFAPQKIESEPPNKLSLKAIAQTYPHHGTRGQLKQQSYAIHTDSISPLLGRELALFALYFSK
ncbi:hypothetical protein [Shewanella holmiensis]|uniref:Uncharacterized protein n=1 Tax=Shewanella holmiensis TaxID=2952222 RepID=A0A9X2WK27_9GAMM|nr:hypothetical protein [Shewanella holmiensis]MCT7940559.1 hypothetical protein [Shewanella holmiensis]